MIEKEMTIKEAILLDVHSYLNKLSHIPEWDIVLKDGENYFIWKYDITLFSLKEYGHIVVVGYLIHKFRITKPELIDELKSSKLLNQLNEGAKNGWKT